MKYNELEDTGPKREITNISPYKKTEGEQGKRRVMRNSS
jgi:hypothetical protein